MRGQAHPPKSQPICKGPHLCGPFVYTGGNVTEKMIQAIEAIIRRGNDAEIRRRGDGYIVLEVKKEIKYSTQRIGVGESHRG